MNKVFNEGVWLLRSKNFKVQQSGKGALKSLFVGFPYAVLQGLQIDFEIVENEHFIEINTQEDYEELAFNAWRSKILVVIEKDRINERNVSHQNFHHFINEIRDYPLAVKTPIEVFMWVSEIQNRIRQF